ncbi:hypothetical protein [Microbacterium sp. CJ88]|uniref:hypothetical protein n=1 Tax=Microbacterium sp. CJ88 TaxID=3445672 RepID=UPI003F65B2CE
MSDSARRVDAAATAVEGVVRLYSAAPAVVGLVRSVLPPETDAALSVVRDGDPAEATVSVGVEAACSSAVIAQAVADAVRAELGPAAVVHVRVSRIEHG